MKKIIAIVLSLFSLTLCFCAPADAVDSVNSSATVCSESVCKKEVHPLLDGIENVVNHPFVVMFFGSYWAFLGSLFYKFVPAFMPVFIPAFITLDTVYAIGFVAGCLSEAIFLYKGKPCDLCN